MARKPDKEDSLDLLKRSSVPVGDILDVGVLTNTKELVQAFRSHRHYLFEPVAEWKEDIDRIYSNAKVDYRLFQIAVSDTTGVVKLEVRSNRPNRPVTHANIVEEAREGYEVREVKSDTLDNLMDAGTFTREPYLLKIDVDGAEEKILAGARRLLAKCSVVILEVHPSDLIRRVKWLEDEGYSIFDVVDFCYSGDFFAQCDLVMVNRRVVLDHNPDAILRPDASAKWEVYAP